MMLNVRDILDLTVSNMTVELYGPRTVFDVAKRVRDALVMWFAICI